MIYLKTYNESIRDKMKPKSKEELESLIKDLTPEERLNIGVRKNLMWLVEKVFDDGIDINKMYDDKMTVGENALVWASLYGYNEIIRFLLNNGCKPTEYIINTVRNSGYGDEKILKLLKDEL